MGMLRKYDPKQIIATWNDIPLTNGIAADTFIETSRNERNASLTMGADGNGTMNIIHNRSGTVAITLRYGSAANDAITAILEQDEDDTTSKVVAQLLVTDFGGNTVFDSNEAFLNGPPDESLGAEEGTRTWTWECPKLSIHSGSSVEAVA